ncbi:MAG TPA: filamentous hemagglutinin-like protein, partial [Syntrophobacteraceae bacterium]|nr:filamentous hemagglutinin-like protein [Syntrophobacteraceae bacterium]
AQGGNIAIAANQVQLLNGSRISAQSSGPGNAGNIDITVGDTFLARNSSVTTEATMADGGDISLKAGYMVRLIDSQITTSVGGGAWTTGGNIYIDPEFVILQRSKVIANAFEGTGGNIQITAGNFIADPDSIVDASSALGIDGTVDIRATISNLSGLVTPLPKDFMSAADLIREPCEVRARGGKQSSFIIRGRDGLPAEPGSFMPSPSP